MNCRTDEFPGEALFIARLTKSNYEFGQLAARYDEVNRQIHRIESEEESTADEVLEGLKKPVSYTHLTLPTKRIV